MLVATGAVCVGGLVALNGPDHTSANDAVAQSAPDYQDIAGWKLETAGELADVTAVDQLLESSGYWTNAEAGKVLCPDLLVETTRAMNTTHPAPDDRMQQKFESMLNNFKAAGDKCVAGDVNGSFAALKAAEQEQKELGLK